uniref:Uncharacterized protein n=1 Tax=Romanomermis culicivorax TaxID=13658 RepID=A0A915IQX4_ROMCU
MTISQTWALSSTQCCVNRALKIKHNEVTVNRKHRHRKMYEKYLAVRFGEVEFRDNLVKFPKEFVDLVHRYCSTQLSKYAYYYFSIEYSKTLIIGNVEPLRNCVLKQETKTDWFCIFQVLPMKMLIFDGRTDISSLEQRALGPGAPLADTKPRKTLTGILQ